MVYPCKLTNISDIIKYPSMSCSKNPQIETSCLFIHIHFLHKRQYFYLILFNSCQCVAHYFFGKSCTQRITYIILKKKGKSSTCFVSVLALLHLHRGKVKQECMLGSSHVSNTLHHEHPIISTPGTWQYATDSFKSLLMSLYTEKEKLFLLPESL